MILDGYTANPGDLSWAELEALAPCSVVEVAAAKADHPLIAAKHCVITPHIAWATRAARRRLISTSADTIAAFLAATQQHVVT